MKQLRSAMRIVGIYILALLIAGPVLAQGSGTVTGTVTDAQTGDPLPGANVYLQGTNAGSATDQNGRYRILNAPPGSYTLICSYIGYQQASQSITLQSGETVQANFALQSKAVTGEEQVVVVGYGTQKKRDLTGSVSKLDGAGINEIPTPRVDQALQGKISGVQVTPESGKPGSQPVIRIRGIGTLNNASPLFVVDGLLTDDISFLNPQNIESVEVLKDASATAIYGSRGANGVIIITTKKGIRNQKPIFNFTAYRGWNQIMHPIDLTNAQEYATLANELADNEGFPEPFDDPQSVGTGTDWQQVVYRAAPTQNYNISARGGSESIAYDLSVNFTKETGIIRKSDYQRVSARLNNDYYLTDHVTVGHNLSWNYIIDKSAPSVVTMAYHADPTIAPRNAQGNFSNANVRSSAGNPEAAIFYHRNDNFGYRGVGNFFGQVDFLKKLMFKSSFNVDLSQSQTKNFLPIYTVSPTQQNTQSALSVDKLRQQNWLWENTLRFRDTLNVQRFEVLAGVTAQQYTQEAFGGRRVNMIGQDKSLWYLNAGDTEGQSNSNSAYSWSMLSYLARLNYALMDRYLLTATIRADGSSRFGADNRFGYFPSFALGWRLSEEPFLRDNPFISNLKLRGSWGIMGNDKISPYPGRPIVTGNLNAVFGPDESLNYGGSLTALANPDVRWEEAAQSNLGLEIGLLNDRITGEIDLYRKETRDILVEVPIPAYIGVNSPPFVNAASVRNTGIDFQANYSSRWGNLKYNLGVLGSTVHNEVLNLGRGKEEILGGGLPNQISFTTKTMVGHPIGAFFGYKTDGIFQNQQEIDAGPTRGGEHPGDIRYVDVNKDGVITADDRTFIGSPIPDFTYGINLGASFKGFDLSASFNGQVGNKIFNGKRTLRFNIENWEQQTMNRWHGEGTSTTEPRVTTSGNNWLPSDRFLQDGSFFKLRNIQIGYTLPIHFTTKFNMTKLRVYLNGTNLFVNTPYTGYTPEIAGQSIIANGIDLGAYPISTTYSFGVQATF